jgi:hypothetical protein
MKALHIVNTFQKGHGKARYQNRESRRTQIEIAKMM